jgi:hypothetical protein
MKGMYVWILLNGCMGACLSASSQTAPADSLFPQQVADYLITAWKKEVAENLHLYNGSEYLLRGHGMKGFPFFRSPDLLKGSVWYDGNLYTGVDLQYDLEEDNLVTRDYTNNVSIRLVKDKIAWFVIDGHRFIHLHQGEGLPVAGFYESLFSGRLNAYARRVKTNVPMPGSDGRMYQSYDTWYIEKQGVFYPVTGDRAVLDILADKKDVIKKYARANKLDFKKDPDTFLEKTVAYYTQLND